MNIFSSYAAAPQSSANLEKNLCALFAIFLLGFNQLSCRNLGSKDGAESDSLKQVEQLVAEEKNFTTPDLSLFGLHGHVSSVSDRMYGKCYTYLTPTRLDFTENGDLTDYIFYDYDENIVTFKFTPDGKSAVRNRDRQYDIKRGNDGRIIEMTPNPKLDYWPEGESYVFHYDNSGKVNAIDYNVEADAPFLKVVKYNDQGLPTKITMEGFKSIEYTLQAQLEQAGDYNGRIQKYRIHIRLQRI